jgi:hypothetical protein
MDLPEVDLEVLQIPGYLKTDLSAGTLSLAE